VRVAAAHFEKAPPCFMSSDGVRRATTEPSLKTTSSCAHLALPVHCLAASTAHSHLSLMPHGFVQKSPGPRPPMPELEKGFARPAEAEAALAWPPRP
jgi:hypothetical protein